MIGDGEPRRRDGWFNTHDLAVCEDGRYRITGRRDDLIVSGDGENLNPNLLEPLLTPEGSGGVCVIGAEEGEGTVPVLLVFVSRFITRGKLLEVGQNVRDLIDRAGAAGRIRRVAFIAGPIMKDAEFKLNRRRLADEYARGELSVVTPESISDGDGTDALTSEIVSFFAVATGKEDGEISPDSDFFLDLNGTSLDYFAMISSLREKFDVPFPSEGGSGLKTPRGIAEFIRQNGGV